MRLVECIDREATTARQEVDVRIENLVYCEAVITVGIICVPISYAAIAQIRFQKRPAVSVWPISAPFHLLLALQKPPVLGVRLHSRFLNGDRKERDP